MCKLKKKVLIDTTHTTYCIQMHRHEVYHCAQSSNTGSDVEMVVAAVAMAAVANGNDALRYIIKRNSKTPRVGQWNDAIYCVLFSSSLSRLVFCLLSSPCERSVCVGFCCIAVDVVYVISRNKWMKWFLIFNCYRIYRMWPLLALAVHLICCGSICDPQLPHTTNRIE